MSYRQLPRIAPITLSVQPLPAILNRLSLRRNGFGKMRTKVPEGAQKRAHEPDADNTMVTDFGFFCGDFHAGTSQAPASAYSIPSRFGTGLRRFPIPNRPTRPMVHTAPRECQYAEKRHNCLHARRRSAWPLSERNRQQRLILLSQQQLPPKQRGRMTLQCALGRQPSNLRQVIAFRQMRQYHPS